MKLIEVVVLLGAHCASPLQQAPAVTEVGKVQCAAIVETDSATGTVRVLPEAASGEPRVAAVMARHRAAVASKAVAGAATSLPPRVLPAEEAQIAPPPHLASGADNARLPPPVAATRIEPAWAPPETGAFQASSKPLKGPGLAPEEANEPPVAAESAAAADSASPAATEETASPPEAVAKPSATPSKKTATKKAAQRKPRKAKPKQAAKAKPKAGQAKRVAQCDGGAKPNWYTTASGKRKYRCVTPGIY